jgi:hypothetical protein
MLKKSLVICLFFLVSFVSANTYINTSLTVSVDLPATEEWAAVELNTSEIDFGEIDLRNTSAPTYMRAKYEIRSQGNVNMTVTPVLRSPDSIFQYLEFGRTYTSGWKQIGEYSFDMNRTYNIGDWSPWFTQSIKLDLTDYLAEQGRVPFDLVDYKSTVIFWVTPRYN